MNEDSKIFGVSSRAFLAVTITITACGMSFMGMKIVEPLYSAFLLSLGFYFGQKSTNKTEVIK